MSHEPQGQGGLGRAWAVAFAGGHSVRGNRLSLRGTAGPLGTGAAGWRWGPSGEGGWCHSDGNRGSGPPCASDAQGAPTRSSVGRKPEARIGHVRPGRAGGGHALSPPDASDTPLQSLGSPSRAKLNRGKKVSGTERSPWEHSLPGQGQAGQWLGARPGAEEATAAPGLRGGHASKTTPSPCLRLRAAHRSRRRFLNLDPL